MLNVPPQIRIESLASIASRAEVILYVPPVILRSSCPEMPLPFDEVTFSVPRPFSTRSSFEKITASVLVSPSAVKVPVTLSSLVVPSIVVTKHLSALAT